MSIAEYDRNGRLVIVRWFESFGAAHDYYRARKAYSDWEGCWKELG